MRVREDHLNNPGGRMPSDRGQQSLRFAAGSLVSLHPSETLIVEDPPTRMIVGRVSRGARVRGPPVGSPSEAW